MIGGVTPIPDLTQAWPPAPCSPPVACSVALTGTHNTYNVGPGQTYTDLTSVPWLSLTAGDVVNIFYRSTPYATKVALRAQGTSSAPVIINGVTDANCTRPVVTGANAVTAADALSQGFFTSTGGKLIEGQGLFVLWQGKGDPYGYKPSFLAIQNLAIEGAVGSNTYSGSQGTQNYSGSAAGIYAVVASVLTIQNCELTGNGEGVFVNTKDDTPAEASYFVTLRGNYIHANGVSGSYLEHNVYVQGVRSLYEGNYIGQLISGALGGSLKDRSSGPVVRYNYILAAARAIDLVDSEGGGGSVLSDPLYNNGWVYGNLIVNGPGGSGDLIHWGGDSEQYANYHQGQLSVYFNTFVNTIGTSIFDMAMSTENVDAHSNIISGTSSLRLCTNSAADGSQVGTIFLRDTNWIQSGYSVGACTSGSTGTLATGSPSLTATFGLQTGSPAVGAGKSYPSGTLTAPASIANLTPTYQPTTTVNGYPTYVPRATVTDLGAFAGP